jgi:hypothetical protein
VNPLAAAGMRDTAGMPPFKTRIAARRALVVVVVNTVIALIITAVNGDAFGVNLVYSQCIGLGI